jgi:hypothetical protein
MGCCHMAWFLIFGKLDCDIGWSRIFLILWLKTGHVFCVWLIEMCHVTHYEHHDIWIFIKKP